MDFAFNLQILIIALALPACFLMVLPVRRLSGSRISSPDGSGRAAINQLRSRRPVFPLFVLIVIGANGVGTAQAAVYKCVGDNGQPTFTDRPCPDSKVSDNVVNVSPTAASSRPPARTEQKRRSPVRTSTSMSWKAECQTRNGQLECVEVEPDVPDVGELNCERATRKAHQWINPRIENRYAQNSDGDGPDVLLDTYLQMKADTSLARCKSATGLSRRFFQCLDTAHRSLRDCIGEFPRM